ncbi:MAG: 2Fe-2S iron-sulfur cluster-binding protein [Gemmatimonadota bacterium]|nr:2Fe-2S iron-sulfur cluster-binding protein [Gemmatimonadota bacterium]
MATTIEPKAVVAPPKMVNLTIEGRAVSVPEGTSILEAGKRAGVLIPHYCYHPGLSIVGNCRMCLVEVEKAPKLAPSCATAVAEGQVVHIYTEKALEARKGVLEMLLINHPLDCPICDKSGECELQDFTYQEGPAESRLRDPKRFNPVEDFGGDVMYTPNRCILCTRCVRFMDEMAQDTVLNVSERGDRALIGEFEGKELTHAWAGNVIDLCPVGALLSKDFLNKARAWEIDHAPSVCPGCSQGCNMSIDTRDNVVVRLRPRPNEAVNKYFMCDVGRLDYRWINRQDRIEVPLLRQGESHAAVDWAVAIPAAAALLDGKRVFVAASPNLSNETLFLLARLMRASGGAGAFAIPTGEEVPLPGVDDLALRAERAANGKGAELFGFRRSATPLDGIAAGDVLVVADADAEHIAADKLALASSVIVIGTTLPDSLRIAAVVLPVANYAEEDGTFTNLRGRVQRFSQARAAPGMARPSWWVVGDLLAALGTGEAYYLASEVFAAMAAGEAPFADMTYESLGMRGLTIAGEAR